MAAAQVVSKVDDKELARELSAIVQSSSDAEAGLRKLELLSRRPGLSDAQRTQVDGLRVNALAWLDRKEEARTLAQELVEERPDLPQRHLILANAAFAASDYPATAKALMEASLRQADIVNQLPAYEILIVAHQLETAGERELKAAFGQRLFDAGWDKGGVGLRSGLALDVINSLLDKGRPDEAARYLPVIADPRMFAVVLAEKRYEPIRRAAVDWAGLKLEKQWPIYLQRTRQSWLSQRSPEAAADYAAALSLAGHDQTIVRTFLPELGRSFEPREDELWIFLVPTVARSLAILGRWEEAFQVFDQAAKTWPPGWSANAINIGANRANLRLLRGDFQSAAGLFDQVLQEATPVADQVTPQTIAVMESYRLCAQHRAGSAGVSLPAERLAAKWGSREPKMIAWLQICLGRRDQALATLLAALTNEEGRSDVLDIVQPRGDTSVDSAFAREMNETLDAVSASPALIEAAGKYAERRTWRIRDAAPSEAKP